MTERSAVTHIPLSAVLTTIRLNITDAGSLRKQAAKWKISPAYLSDVMNRNRLPGRKILEQIGLEVMPKAQRPEPQYQQRSKRVRRPSPTRGVR